MEELDPTQRIQLDALDAEYSRQYGVAVDYIKAEVGHGDEYSNAVARVVLSPNGAWFECKDLPMEFSGAAGAPVGHRFVTDREALDLLGRLKSASETVSSANSTLFSLLVLYTRTGIADGRNVYSFHFQRRSDGIPARPQEIGRYQPGVLPLVFKCRLNADTDAAGLSFRRGVLVCLANVGEMNLVVEMPYEGEELNDLSYAPVNPVTQ
jgi:hypothetical protein